MSEENIRFFNGEKFVYKSTNKSYNIRYFECSYKGCGARGKESDTTPFTLTKTTHNHHKKNSNPEQIYKFKKALHSKVQSSMNRTRKIYDEVAFEHSMAAAEMPFVHIDRSMRRWRSKVCPRRPKSLQEYATLLNLDEWKHLLHYDQGHLTISSTEFQDDEGKVFHVINIANVELLNSIQSNEFCIDATYNVCPRYVGIFQLVTIMALVDNTFEPVFWSLMPRKIENAYRKVCQQFLLWTPHMQHEVFHTDYELALSNAINSIFPNVTIIYCYFHYLYNLLKRLKLLVGKQQMKLLLRWKQGKIFYRKLMALPLFPEDDIPGVLEWIEENAAPRQKIFFSGLLKYIKKTWIRKIGVRKFCVYKAPRRTNNPIESYHCQLRKKFGSHPLIWEFTRGLVQVASIAHCELSALHNSLTVRRSPEHRYRVHEEVLERAWQLYENNILDIPKFLSCANHFLRGFGNQQIIQNVLDVEYFSNATEHNINAVPPMPRIEIDELGPNADLLPIIFQVTDRLDILLFRRLENSLCKLCLYEIADYITIPCHHWFGCLTCIDKVRDRCEEQNLTLHCACGHVIIAFTRVQVS